MSFFEKLQPYTDGYGLVATTPLSRGTERASDNGVLFTSQALILNAGEEDPSVYAKALAACIDPTGTLHRAPNDTSLDEPDDHYGILSLYAIYPQLAVALRPRARLLLQPVMLYLYLLTSCSFLATLGVIFLSPLVSMIMALSNLNEDTGNTSNKLLSWTTCQALKHRGWLPALGAKFWEWRMRKIYGSMHTMFSIYYGANHPFLTRL